MKVKEAYTLFWHFKIRCHSHKLAAWYHGGLLSESEST